MKALVIKEMKHLENIKLISDKILQEQYKEALKKAPEDWSCRKKVENWPNSIKS